MRNPWLKRNPLMSMWLSAANTAIAPARAQATAQARRHANAFAQQGARQVTEFWSAVLGMPPARKKRRR